MSEPEQILRSAQESVAQTEAALREVEASLAASDARLERAGGEQALRRMLDDMSATERDHARAEAAQQVAAAISAADAPSREAPRRPKRPRMII